MKTNKTSGFPGREGMNAKGGAGVNRGVKEKPAGGEAGGLLVLRSIAQLASPLRRFGPAGDAVNWSGE